MIVTQHLLFITHLPSSIGTNTSTTQGPNTNELKYTRTTSISSGFAISDGTVYNADNHIYMNPNINTNMASTSTQTEVFEISDPTKTGNSLSNITTGIGNFLDGASNIASLTVTLDSVEKEKAEYNGFTANTGSQSASYTGSNHFLNSVSQADMYTTTTQKGFRLKGQYHLNDIARTNVTSYIGPAKSAPYVLNIAFTRTQPTYSANYTTNVYVDDLSVSPSKDGSNSSDTITVRAVSNCMGYSKCYKVRFTLCS